GTGGPSVLRPAGATAADVGRPPGAMGQDGLAAVTFPSGTFSPQAGVPAVAPSLPNGDSGRRVITTAIFFPPLVRDLSNGTDYTRIGLRTADGCTDAALVSSALAEQIE